MAGSSQPQHFFAAGCLFADFAIAVIFFPVIKNLWKFIYILFAFCHTQILNLRAKINFANMLKIVWKWGKTLNLPDFQIIFNILAKLIFALKFNIWLNTHIICTTIFIKLLLQSKKWQLENLYPLSGRVNWMCQSVPIYHEVANSVR